MANDNTMSLIAKTYTVKNSYKSVGFFLLLIMIEGCNCNQVCRVEVNRSSNSYPRFEWRFWWEDAKGGEYILNENDPASVEHLRGKIELPVGNAEVVNISLAAIDEATGILNVNLFGLNKDDVIIAQSSDKATIKNNKGLCKLVAIIKLDLRSQKFPFKVRGYAMNNNFVMRHTLDFIIVKNR